MFQEHEGVVVGGPNVPVFMKPTVDQVRVVLDLERTKKTEQRTKRSDRDVIKSL
jgi:hypothetical protein